MAQIKQTKQANITKTHTHTQTKQQQQIFNDTKLNNNKI